ncbi:MAG TPA: D-aminoacyl-tRNA deacylase [Gemmatimonadales bacterium]|nr:D-aminoacyl-tRNA deacylase [Gemmatimonadales bacterium]
MRVVLQRVSRAQVRVAGETVGEVGRGFVALVGFAPHDTEETLGWMADKILQLRVFSDTQDKMNLALADVNGGVLVVSQFTLYGDASKGRRPSFIDAAPPEQARALYDQFVVIMKERAAGIPIATGQFQAQMDVELVNDGPVTLMLEK